MSMRILDSQRYWAFFKAYVVSFVSLVGLYIVIDAFSNIDEFTKVTTNVGELFAHMGHYYLVRTAFFYDRLCGVITMMAAIFTVTWMQKNNELLAMLAAGIGTKRAIMPVLVSSLLVSFAAIANQEFILPQVAEDLQRPPDDDGKREVTAGSRWDVNEIQLQGQKGVRAEQTVDHFHATMTASRFGTLLTLDAPYARYIPENDPLAPKKGGWLLWGARLSPAGTAPDDRLLFEVKPQDFSKYPRHRGDAPPPGSVYFLRSNITFANIIRRPDWYMFAPTPAIVRALSEQGSATEKVQMDVFLHGRLVRPITSMILLMLSLPLVLGGEGRNMFINLGLSLGTSALFYGLTFMVNYLGGNKVLSPELTAWIPIIAFGSLAAARWDDIRT